MQRTVYIYCYTNKSNGHKYVGQTYNLKQRQADHKSCAYNVNHKDYNSLFHRKLREYGYENFTFEVLTEQNVNSQEEADELESFWIDRKDSYVKNNHGYNLTRGGQGSRHHFERALINEELLYQIIFDIKNTNMSLVDIEKKYNLPNCYITGINNGIKFRLPNEVYPIRPPKEIDKKRILEFMIQNPQLTRQNIADYFDVSLSTIKRIKAANKELFK